MYIPKKVYKELDFDKRVKLDSIRDKKVKITFVGRMKTAYGTKNFAEFMDGKKYGWVYLTKPLDHVLDYFESHNAEPFETTFTKVKSQKNNEYWSTNLPRKGAKQISIADKENERIYIYAVRWINTKFGDKVIVYYFDEKGERCKSFTSWLSMYDELNDIINDMSDSEFEESGITIIEEKNMIDVGSDFIVVDLIKQHSKKSDKDYIGYDPVNDAKLPKAVRKAWNDYVEMFDDTAGSDDED